MRKLKYGLISLLVFFMLGSLSVQAAPKKISSSKKVTNVAKKQVKRKIAADSRVRATRTASGKIVVDRRIPATRQYASKNKRHKLASYRRGSARLAPISFPKYSRYSRRAPYSVARQAGLDKVFDPLSLTSSAAYILDQSSLKVLFKKNAHIPLPMASVTKLMTALVVVESMQDMNEIIEVTKEDASRALGSRLKVGTQTTRGNLLHLALMSSENRAAAALGRNYPGGYPAFVAAMNIKAQVLGMSHTHYVDTTGLSKENVASAQDLAKLVMAAAQHPILKQYSTDTGYEINDGFRYIHYANTNSLVHNPHIDIELQKTGFISAAGNCVVMQVMIENRPVVMVFLDAPGKKSRAQDVLKIRDWLQDIKLAKNKPQV